MTEFRWGAAVIFLSTLVIVWAVRYLLDREGTDIFARHGILN